MSNLRNLFYLGEDGTIVPKSCHATKKPFAKGLNRYGADEGNRTLVSTMARLRSTIELHLRLSGGPDGT